MRLNDIRDNFGAKKRRKRVGRGIGSGKGKTSCRGGKGQTARSGVAIKGFEGGQMPLHRRLPHRGFVNFCAKNFAEINICDVQRLVDSGRLSVDKVVCIEELINIGVIKGRFDGLRVLGRGEITSKMNFRVDGASRSAIEAISSAGGACEVVSRCKEEVVGK
ncbi:50S ribosomal protein L15 [Candidatus Hydrogenosomobacter endosymbioticus]|uniref:Large ribosomal subunit protein uL15 n=1 Tax=Candidatus Hydrogenosomobacter endosymbioticus TaxID=2558174 RepID=A0ABM7V8A0_9PROT|nr:50S ribosomal protein L15 [Candidatus Hydrogenosomobacter endosymbioticus]BDB96001.1 50S ribosomal protein L15 [Candidatus Hydrogenosomobacter endosymbioticus]